jgi:hypothetical protein
LHQEHWRCVYSLPEPPAACLRPLHIAAVYC